MTVRREPLPWRLLILFALAGTAIAVTITLADLSSNRSSTGGLIHTGPQGPAAALLARDFPNDPQSSFGEHDGPMFYAIARSPWHLDVAAESLDRPRYRLQHPLLSWLSWAAHPVGGGDPLLWTMFGVGVAGIFLGCLSMGALSSTLRGPAYLGVLFGILPGTFMSLRITTADALAVALMLTALVLSLRDHTVLAALAGVATVLAKEPMFLGLVGLALWRRDRRGLALVLPAAVVAGAWFLWLRQTVTATGDMVMEFGVPFVGLFSSVRLWAQGIDVMAMVSVVPATVLTVVAFVRSRLAPPAGAGAAPAVRVHGAADP